MATINIKIQAKEQASRAFSRVQQDIQRLNSTISTQKTALSTANKQYRNIHSTLLKLQTPLAVVTQGMAAITQHAGNLTKNFVTSASNMETYRSTLQAVTGDSDETNRVLERLLKLTTELVGIDTGTLIQYAARLQAAGLEAEQAETVIRGMTERIAEQGKSSAVTKRVLEQFAQAINTGTVSAQDFKPILREMPTLFRDASIALGVQINSIEDLRNAVQAATSPTEAFVAIAAQMAKASKGADLENLSSQLDILKDSAMLLASELGKFLLPVVKDIVKQLNEWIEAIRNLGDTEKAVIAWTVAIITALTGIGTAIGAVLLAITGLSTALGAIGTTVAGSKGITVLRNITTVIKTLGTQAGLAASAILTLIQAWKQIWGNYTGDMPFPDAIDLGKNFDLSKSPTAKEQKISEKTFENYSGGNAQKIEAEIKRTIERIDQLIDDLGEAMREGPWESETALRKELTGAYEKLNTLQEELLKEPFIPKKLAEYYKKLEKGTIPKREKRTIPKRPEGDITRQMPDISATIRDAQAKSEGIRLPEKPRVLKEDEIEDLTSQMLIQENLKEPLNELAQILENTRKEFSEAAKRASTYKPPRISKPGSQELDELPKPNIDVKPKGSTRGISTETVETRTETPAHPEPKLKKVTTPIETQTALSITGKEAVTPGENAPVTAQQNAAILARLKAEEDAVAQKIRRMHQLNQQLVSTLSTSLVDFAFDANRSFEDVLENFVRTSAKMVIQSKIDALFQKKISDDLARHKIANEAKVAAAQAQGPISAFTAATPSVAGIGASAGIGAALSDPSGIAMGLLLAATLGPPLVSAIKDGFTDTKVEMDGTEVGRITANTIARQQRVGDIMIF